MPEKDSEDSFYYLNAYQDDITPGQKMTILHNISFNDWRAGPHIAPLVTLTREEVTQRKEASITLEKELYALSLIHISEPTRQAEISYAVFCLKKKKTKKKNKKKKKQKKQTKHDTL